MGLVGYFTAEIGLWSELHTYSGGLGVLAGDHVKSAADAEIDLIGVTLLYREGYGRQHIDSDVMVIKPKLSARLIQLTT